MDGRDVRSCVFGDTNNMNFNQTFFKSGFFSIILFYVIGDLVTTYYGLAVGYESNPLMAPLLYSYGFQALIVAKIIFLIGLVFVYEKIKLNVIGWKFTKNAVVSLGVFLTVSNTCVIVYGYDLITIFGLIVS